MKTFAFPVLVRPCGVTASSVPRVSAAAGIGPTAVTPDRAASAAVRLRMLGSFFPIRRLPNVHRRLTAIHQRSIIYPSLPLLRPLVQRISFDGIGEQKSPPGTGQGGAKSELQR